MAVGTGEKAVRPALWTLWPVAWLMEMAGGPESPARDHLSEMLPRRLQCTWVGTQRAGALPSIV